MERQAFDLDTYNAELDSMLSGVMPDSWLGHGRLTIHERGFSGKKRRFAKTLTERLADKHPNKPAAKLAEKAIELTEERLD